MDVFCWIDRVWSSKECVCCGCDPSVHLDVPSIDSVYVCMLEVISSFRSLRAGSEVFALLMLFLCVILHTMWSSVYKCQRVECAFTSPVRTECGMFVMRCMSVSTVL